MLKFTCNDFKIGDYVKYPNLYESEVFEVIGLTYEQIQIKGDFSGGTHNVCQAQWVKIEEIVPHKVLKVKEIRPDFKAERYNGRTRPLGHEIIEHQCSYRMCDVCGGDNQKLSIVKNTNKSIRIGDYLVQNGSDIRVVSESCFKTMYQEIF